jgi:hypothetical protein
MVCIALSTHSSTLDERLVDLDKDSQGKLGIGLWDLSVLLVDAGPNQVLLRDSADRSGVSAAAERLEAKGYITIQKTSGEQTYMTLIPTTMGQKVLDRLRQQSLVVPVRRP